MKKIVFALTLTAAAMAPAMADQALASGSPANNPRVPDKAEIMEITDGSCVVVQDGSKEEKTYGAGTHFYVAPKSGFTITVSSGICQYICSFIG